MGSQTVNFAATSKFVPPVPRFLSSASEAINHVANAVSMIRNPVIESKAGTFQRWCYGKPPRNGIPCPFRAMCIKDVLEENSGFLPICLKRWHLAARHELYVVTDHDFCEVFDPHRVTELSPVIEIVTEARNFRINVHN